MPSLQDILNPAVPAGAYDDLLATALPVARQQRVWEPSDGPLPALFVSHGAPPTLDDRPWLDDLFAWGQSMPKPRAIVVVSAHWENAPAALSSSAAGTPLYYDFGGFHPHYYTLKYATPDAADLAARIAGTLRASAPGSGPVHEFASRGLDHGAFIPLMAMYPAADVPVVQLSMPSLDPAALLALGSRLRTLREEGILILGSGFMTHSFAVIRNASLTPQMDAFDAWAADAVHRGDVDTLTDYLVKAPAAKIAHPTADHFVPLLLALGAANDPKSARTVFDRSFFGNHIRSIQVD